jgi:hypothetical protein
VRGERQLVLLGAADAPLGGGDRGVLAHGQPGARLGIARDVRPEHLPRAQPAGGAQPPAQRLRAVELQQGAAHLLVDAQRRVARGVHAAGDADVDLP